MRVKSCEASDNQNRPIQLSDNDGCVLRPKMVSKFMKMRSTDPRATVVTYAFFHAFKFPDSMAVHIRYVSISLWNSNLCRLNLKPLKKPSGIKIRVSKKLRLLFKHLPIADTLHLISYFSGLRKLLLLKIFLSTPQNKSSNLNKAYINISNMQKCGL